MKKLLSGSDQQSDLIEIKSNFFTSERDAIPVLPEKTDESIVIQD